MVDTHCLPGGTLGTAEVAVSNVGSANITTSDPGVGSRRGIIVLIHPLLGASPATFPIPVPNSGSAGSYLRFGDFETAVVADGWIFEYVSVPEDFYIGGNPKAIYNDVSADTGHGARYLNHGIMNHWDQITAYNTLTYGANRPTIVVGHSMGAFKTLQVAINYSTRTNALPANLIGYIAHCPATILENADPIFTSGLDFFNLNWSGMDLTASSLAAVTIPGIVGYGTNDNAVGWAATTFAGTTGTNVNTFTGTQSLSVASSANILFGPSVQVVTSTGTAILQFTGTGTGTLTDCTTVSGTGTITNGAAVTQSLTDQIITNGLNTTRNATTDTHEFTGTPSGAGNDAATYAAWIATNLDPTHPVSF